MLGISAGSKLSTKDLGSYEYPIMAAAENDKAVVPVIDEKQMDLFREFISVQKEELDIRKRDQDIRSASPITTRAAS